MTAWGARDATDGERHSPRRGSPPVLDSGGDDVHSALVPPGALHQRVTAALANWQLDDAEELLADVERDPTPFDAPETEGPADLHLFSAKRGGRNRVRAPGAGGAADENSAGDETEADE